MPTAPRTALALAAALALAPAALPAQDPDPAPFTWSGAVGAGGWLQIRNVNGSVRVEGTSGSQVEVRATKRVRRGNADDVRIEVKRFDGDRSVVVCAVWGESRCDEEGYHGRSNTRDSDVRVDFVVRVPRGVNVEPHTVNGAVRVADVTGEVRASTVNGNVEAYSLGGPVEVETVNGDVDARMGRMGTRDMRFGTVNGSVTLALPDALDADVELQTVNGHLDADYPLTLSGRVNPRHLRATIGRGGPRLKVSTVNGSVTLKKAG